jgi:hypothetical protein
MGLECWCSSAEMVLHPQSGAGKKTMKNHVRTCERRWDCARRTWPADWGHEADRYRIENCKYNPTLELAMKMARLLGSPVEEIFVLTDQ